MDIWQVSDTELRRIQEDVRKTLHLSDDVPLLPGTHIGLLRVNCRAHKVPDFNWPGINSIVITKRTVDALIQHRLTGWRIEPVLIANADRLEKRPDIYELVIEGRAGWPVYDPPFEVFSVCPGCGRMQHTPVIFEDFTVDTAQWDGSDLFRFDPPCHGLAFATERVKQAFAEAVLTNYALTPIEELVDDLAEFQRSLRTG
jgi:hypothetical protein